MKKRWTYRGQETDVATTQSAAVTLNSTRRNNSQGQFQWIRDALGNKTSYWYDPHNHLTQVQSPSGALTSMVYNTLGFKTAMTDPDMGHWQYGYDGLGELVYQQDGKGAETQLHYDALGRSTQREEYSGITGASAALTSHWDFDTCAHGTGKLCATRLDGGSSQSTSFDALSRPVQTTVNVVGLAGVSVAASFTTNTSYDGNSRVSQIAYPVTDGASQRLIIHNRYHSNGELEQVSDAQSNLVYWQELGRTADGQPKSAHIGPFLQSRRYDVVGRPQGIYTGTADFSDPAAPLPTAQEAYGQNTAYTWDHVGNLTTRSANAAQAAQYAERFSYDVLNRLSSVTGPQNQSMTYFADGRLQSKSDVGYYAYAGSSHQVCAISSAPQPACDGSYQFDGTGNLTQGTNRSVTWTPFNMVQQITRNLNGQHSAAQFNYDANHQRISEQEFDNANQVSKTILYLGPEFFEAHSGAAGTHTVYKHYIPSPEGSVAIITQDGSNQSTQYLLRDHLGSVEVIVDANVTQGEALGYDAWGQRRNINGSAGNDLKATYTERGFTGHEHIEAVGLINMNGRVYDPVLGRFLSADPNVPHPENGQSYDRYQYVLNNPLSLTDPSGFAAGDGEYGGETHEPMNSEGFFGDNAFFLQMAGISATTALNSIGQMTTLASNTSEISNTIAATLEGVADKTISILKQNGRQALEGIDKINENLMAFGPMGVELRGLESLAVMGITGIKGALMTDKAAAIAVGSASKAVNAAAAENVITIEIVGEANSGLRTSVAISAERAETFLVKNGMSADRAADYTASFDGPITARLVRPGEDFLRYTDMANSTGSFLTKTRFANPAAAVDGLYLRPYGNGASLMQSVSSTGRSIMLEGSVANGSAGVRQSVIINRGAFQFGKGLGY